MSEDQKEQPQEVKKEISVIEKVELMNALVKIIKDSEFIKLIKSKENGDLIYDVFYEAATRKITDLMDNKTEKKEDIHTISAVTKELQSTMDFFMNSDFITVLAALNNNITNPKPEQSQARKIINKKPQQSKEVQDSRPYRRGDLTNATGIY